MRIGIDAREMCGRRTGAGRYLGGLLREWAAGERTGRHELIVYAPEPIDVALDAGRCAMRVVPGSPGSWWEQVRLPPIAAADRLDVFFAPAYTAPLRLEVPTVVAIHDLSFVAHPEWFRLSEGVRRRWLTRESARRASAIVTISEFSRRELIDRWGVADSRVHVIPPGITPPGTDLDGGPREERVLFVGSMFNRRHVPDLVRSFAAVARVRPGASLDLVGDNRTHPREDLERIIASERLADRVRWHRYVSDDDLGRLYASARAFAFLSEYEGLGLTPLEALAAGVPPVVVDTPVARESCAGAALYVPLVDLAATSRAIERVLVDESTRTRVLAAAPAALAKYSWPRAAEETLALIERAGSGR